MPTNEVFFFFSNFIGPGNPHLRGSCVKTNRVWIGEKTDLAGHVLSRGPGAHRPRPGLLTGVDDMALREELIQVTIKVPATKNSHLRSQYDANKIKLK